jgi:hypothetical protein
MSEIPLRKYLPRKVVLQAVGGRRALERHEGEGALRRYYPCRMKQARYLRSELVALLTTLQLAEVLR